MKSSSTYLITEQGVRYESNHVFNTKVSTDLLWRQEWQAVSGTINNLLPSSWHVHQRSLCNRLLHRKPWLKLCSCCKDSKQRKQLQLTTYCWLKYVSSRIHEVVCLVQATMKVFRYLIFWHYCCFIHHPFSSMQFMFFFYRYLCPKGCCTMLK